MKLRSLLLSLLATFAAGIILCLAVDISTLPAIRSQQHMQQQELALLQIRSGFLARKTRGVSPASQKQGSLPFPVDSCDVNNFSDLERIRLCGIVQGALPLAFLEFTENGAAGIFREGEWVGSLKIKSIRDAEVVVCCGDQDRVLRMEADGPQDDFCRKISETETVFNKKMLTTAALKLAGEANAVRLSPVGGKQKVLSGGLRINNVVQGGIMEEMGLRNDDIVCQVNGMRTDNLFSLLPIAQKLKSVKIIELKLRRNDAPLVLKYSVR